MSSAGGRTAASMLGVTDARQEVLDRVDALLRVLAQDKLLQEDLRHPDVKKALEHWTGQNRLSQDDADELMEDNYRIQAVCSRMVELQSVCKQACIGLPLSHVLAGKGLYDQPEEAAAVQAQVSSTRADGSEPSGSRGGSDSNLNRPKGAGEARGGQQHCSKEDPGIEGGGGRGRDLSWRQTLLEEVLRLTVVCLCALVFTLLLKHFRGDDPLGKGLAGEQGSPSLGRGEL